MEIYDSGFNNFLTKDPLFPDTVQSSNVFSKGIASQLIQSGDVLYYANMVDGYMQSSNFVTGSTGWRIDAEGNVEFDSGYFRGDITGASGAFSGSISIGSGNNIFKADSNGIYLGNATFASAPFRVTMAGALTATSVTISGALTTGAGSAIGGTYIDSLDVSKLNAGTITSKAITLAVTDTAGDVKIQAGKTDFDNTAAGFILGLDDSDSNKAKFYIGSTTVYFNWDGTDVVVVGGTITGGVIRTVVPGAATGSGVVMNGGNNEMVRFYYNTTQTGTIKGYTTEGAETTYLSLDAASGRAVKLKDSMVQINGDLVPDSDEDHDCGKSDCKWNNVYAQILWQQTNTDGSRKVYDFGYIEKGLIPDKLLERVTKNNNNLQNINGFIPGLKMNFKQGSVLKWTEKGLKESEKETDFVIAIADENGLPMVLGAEPVRVIGKATIGDYIVPSDKKGCAKAVTYPDWLEVIGRCLENKKDSKERLLKVMIKF